MSLLDKFFNELYYETKKFENRGKVYELLGIRAFKKLVMKMTKRGKVDNYNIMTYSISGLKEYDKKSRNNEKIHFIGFLIMFLLIIIMLFLLIIFQI